MSIMDFLTSRPVEPVAPMQIDGAAAARRLQELSCLSDRERYRARARMMREDAGLPPSPYLEPRSGQRCKPQGE